MLVDQSLEKFKNEYIADNTYWDKNPFENTEIFFLNYVYKNYGKDEGFNCIDLSNYTKFYKQCDERYTDEYKAAIELIRLNYHENSNLLTCGGVMETYRKNLFNDMKIHLKKSVIDIGKRLNLKDY